VRVVRITGKSGNGECGVLSFFFVCVCVGGGGVCVCVCVSGEGNN